MKAIGQNNKQILGFAAGHEMVEIFGGSKKVSEKKEIAPRRAKVIWKTQRSANKRNRPRRSNEGARKRTRHSTLRNLIENIKWVGVHDKL